MLDSYLFTVTPGNPRLLEIHADAQGIGIGDADLHVRYDFGDVRFVLVRNLEDDGVVDLQKELDDVAPFGMSVWVY